MPWISSGGKMPAGDGKILHGPLRLGTVVRLGRHADVAHRIPLDAEISHLPNLAAHAETEKEPGPEHLVS